MNVPFVDLRRQLEPLMPEIQAACNRVIERCAFINGPEVKAFEKKLADYLGVGGACSLSNGTHALALTLQALGIGPGDEVITVPNTAFPTSEAIHLAGAEVVFADIASGSFSLDPAAAEQAISARTRALIPVHLYGIPADMDALMELAEKHHLFVIEDVAQAQGARYRDRLVGTFGHAACFSFFPSKNLGAFGDGGAMASNDTGLVKKVRMLANHGREEKFTHLIKGTNSRLDTLKAAQLSICLDYLDQWNAQRRRAAALYDELLQPYEKIIRPQAPEGCEAVWHLYAIRCAQRDRLAEFLNQQGIKTGLHYPLPLHLQPVYDYLGLAAGSFPEAEAACQQVLSLPMFPAITVAEIQAVCEAVGQFFESAK